MDEKMVMQLLQNPFLPEEIEWRVGSTNKEKTKGIALAYVTNRAIQNRLDDVFGAFGWRNEYKEWKEKSQLCGISVKVGDEWITKWDGADDSNMDAVKGGLSDAMKRAAYQWGIGRYLYKLENVWCEIVGFGNSWKLKSNPKLPTWALPQDFTPPPETTTETQQVQADTFPQESINEDLAAIERESKATYGKTADKPSSTVTPIGNFVSEGQVKMLYAKWSSSEYKALTKPDFLELLSAQLAKNVTDFKFVEKADINKAIKWLDEHKAA